MLMEVLSISVAKLEQRTIVADVMEVMGDAAAQMLIVLTGDPGLGGPRSLTGLLDHCSLFVVDVPHINLL